MIVLFDLLNCQPASAGSKFHGGGEYIKTVFERMANVYSNHCTLIVFFDDALFIDEWIKEIIQKKNIKTYNVKSYQEIEKIFEKEIIDVFYTGMPYGYREIIIPDSVVKVGTFHGLRPIECPIDKYQYKYSNGPASFKTRIRPVFKKFLVGRSKGYYEASLRTFDEIICVSNHTSYSIQVFFPHLNEKQRKFQVFYTPSKYLENQVIEKSKQVKDKYIMLIGLNRWEKNSYRVIAAFEELFASRQLQGYKIVTVGKIPNKVKDKIRDERCYEFFDYVEPEVLENLYRNCDFFVYPTLNEGFGMPPLEAMRYGKTCVVSAVCSLPEICEDAVYYVNPYDIPEIKNRILQAVDNKINVDVIEQHYEKIRRRQDQDLDGLCQYIIRERC